MTTNESIKAIKDYLKFEAHINEDDFNEIQFVNEEAILRGKHLFNFYYDGGGMDLLTLEYDEICSLNMDTLTEIFSSLYYQVYCQDCKGSHDECEHENVIYPL